MKTRIALFFLFCLLYVNPDVQGAEDRFALQRLGTPSRLDVNSIHRVIADRTGFLWLFGLNNVFFRFDGNQITEAKKIFGKQILNTVSDEPHIDARNNLWLGDMHHIVCLNLATLKKTRFQIYPSRSQRPSKITAITSAGKYTYVGGHSGKIYRLNPDLKEIKQIADISALVQEGILLPSITHLVVFESALYFTVIQQGLFKVTGDGQVERIAVPGSGVGEHTKFNWLATDGKSLYGQGDFNGLIAIKKGAVKIVAQDQTSLTHQYYPLSNGYFAHFMPSETVIEKLENDRMSVRDRLPFNNPLNRHWNDQTGLYFANNDGIYNISQKDQLLFEEGVSFKNFNTRNASIRSIFKMDDHIYLGTYDGLFKMDSPQKGHAQQLSENVVYTSLPDKYGNMWLGFEGNGLKLMDRTGRITDIFTSKDVDNTFITELEYLGRDSLLIGTYQGLYYYSIASRSLQWQKFPNDTYETNRSMVRKMEVSGNRVYFCGEKGFFWFDRSDASKLRRPVNLPSSLYVYDFQISLPHIWLATRNQGLIKYNVETNTYVSFTETDGLAGNTVFSFVQKDNYMICGTVSGLSLVNLATRNIRNFHKEDGLPSNEFNQGASLIDGDRIFMGTIRGVVYFTLNSLLAATSDRVKRPLISALSITNLLGKESRVIYNLAYTNDQEIRLSSPERVVALDFSSMSGNPDDYISYKVGEQGNWLKITGNSLTLAGLDPGLNQIIFRTNDSEQQSKLTLVVFPYFYETWWFAAFIFLLVVGLVVLYFRFRLQKVREENALRTRISSDLHDEIGGILTGISLQADYLLHSSRKDLNVRENLQNISDSGRKAAISMGDMVWSIDARNDDWESLLTRMREYAYSLFDAAEINFEFTNEPEHPADKMLPVLRQNLYLVYKEAVNNICKHSKATSAFIHLDISGSGVSMVIRDNGTGIGPDLRKSGQGIKNMRMRTERSKGTMEFENLDPGFELRFVFKNKNYPAG